MKSLMMTAAAVGVMLVASQAHAGAKIQAIGLTRVHGAVEFNANQNRDPFVAQVFSSGGECLRIAVVSQGADLEATLVSPSGRVWQDDDSNGSLRPRLHAVTDVRGWYPLTLSHFAGTAVNVDFSMDIQRLPTASCNPVSPPVRFAAPMRAGKSGGAGPAVQGGAN
jgi:hypothetical protein